MTRRTGRLAAGMLALLCGGAAHAEPAVTARATDLLAQSAADAAVIAQLPADTKVEVLRRSGAWNEVKTASGQTGWVRMLALRLGDGKAGAAPAGGNPLAAVGNLLGGGRTTGTATVTTGVRGLDVEDLQNASANQDELKKMLKFATDKKTAAAYAQRSKLVASKIDYAAPAAGERGTGGQ